MPGERNQDAARSMIGVLNTRPRDQAPPLSRLLREAGYAPREISLVELILREDAVKNLGETGDVDAFLLSSPNLLPLLLPRLDSSQRSWLAGKPWYLISAAARSQVETMGASVAFVPKQPSLRGFFDEFPAKPGLRLLHLCSEKTRLNPADFLRHGVSVHNLAVYAPRSPAGSAVELEKAWESLRAVLFASGSAVDNLFTAVPHRAQTLGGTNGPIAVTLGPSASDALRSHGVKNFHQASDSGDAGLIAALAAVFFPERKT